MSMEVTEPDKGDVLAEDLAGMCQERSACTMRMLRIRIKKLDTG